MKQGQLKYGDSLVHYSQWGSGTALLIAIPGFGEASGSFSCIGERIGEAYTLVALDLPLHGATAWKAEFEVDPKSLLQVIEELISVIGFRGVKYGLIGYSMGARIALSIYELSSAKIKHLLLIAPDGFRMHFTYWLSTQTTVGNKIFKWTTHHPAGFLKLAGLANSIGLLSKGQLRFSKLYLQESSGQSLYNIWTAFRKFRPGRKRVAQLLHEQQTPVTLIFGRYDPMIHPQTGERFRKDTHADIKIEVIDGGHQLLTEKYAPLICSFLQSEIQVNLK